MHMEIKQLEEDSEVKGGKIAEDADVNQRKKINKMSDEMTAEALESKSVLNWDGKNMDVKTDSVQEEHKQFLSENKAAIHAAYEDISKELKGNSKEAEKKDEDKKEDKKEEPKKADEKEAKKDLSQNDENEGTDSESGSESEGEESDNDGKKKKKKSKSKKSKKGKKKKSRKTDSSGGSSTSSHSLQ